MKKIFFYVFLLLSIKANAQNTDSLGASPNTFKNNTTIYFRISKPDSITLCVYNRWGQEIISIYKNTYLTAGEYNNSVTLTDSIKDGIYLVNLKGNNTSKAMTIKKDKNFVNTITFKNYDDKIQILDKNLLIDIEGVKNVSIYNVLGKVEAEHKYSKNNTIDLQYLISGVYIVKVYSNDNKVLGTKKIIID